MNSPFPQHRPSERFEKVRCPCAPNFVEVIERVEDAGIILRDFVGAIELGRDSVRVFG